MTERRHDGPTVHDDNIDGPRGCPRGLSDCSPLGRIASVIGQRDGWSGFCCGQNGGTAPVADDTLRLCVRSVHDQGPVDIMVNFDERDATDCVYVLMSGLVECARLRAIATGTHGHTLPDGSVIARPPA